MVRWSETFASRAAASLVVLFAGTLVAVAQEDRLVVNTATGEYVFTVEVVDTVETRGRGLMFRESLAPDAGMLFDFEREAEVAFWMENTLIPLDMIFISQEGVVETIHVNAKPLDRTSIPSGVPVRFVLEIPGGRSTEIGLEPGDTIEHERIGTE